MSYWIEPDGDEYIVAGHVTRNAAHAGQRAVVARGPEEFCLKYISENGLKMVAPPVPTTGIVEEPAPVEKSEEPEDVSAVEVTPAAQKLANKFGIDASTLQPGKNGKVGVGEVRKANKG